MKTQNIVFSIALEGYKKTFKECINTHKKYCNKCGYEYVLVDEAPRPVSSAEAAWLKVALLCSALKSDYDWVAFLDADCEVRKGTPCFSEYLGSVGAEKSIFVAPGFSGRINSGVIFAKSNAESIRFFEQVIASADQEVPEDDKAPYENGHMIFHGKRSSAVYLLDHHLWNNNSEIDEESYIQHYSGGKLRSWFIENRAPFEIWKKYVIKKGRGGFAGKIRQIVMWATNKFMNNYNIYSTPKSISESLDKLMPYYKERYPTLSRQKRNG